MDAVAAPTLASPATPPVLRLVVLAVQHVLVMHAVAVAVPLILGGALRLPREQVALLINADLFACGVATIIQSRGIGPVGIRILSTVDFEARGNPVVVAVSIGCGTIPLVAPTLFHAAPDMLRTSLDSGILLATIAAVALNIFFNGTAPSGAEAPFVASDHI